jgi:hypothetical protein
VKKFVVVTLALIIGLTFSMTGFAQDKKTDEATAPAVKTEAPATPDKPVVEKKVTKKKTKKKTTKTKKPAKPATKKEIPATSKETPSETTTAPAK